MPRARADVREPKGGERGEEGERGLGGRVRWKEERGLVFVCARLPEKRISDLHIHVYRSVHVYMRTYRRAYVCAHTAHIADLIWYIHIHVNIHM